MDRPRDKKKVIRAPAVSASFCSTNLRRERGGGEEVKEEVPGPDSRVPL